MAPSVTLSYSQVTGLFTCVVGADAAATSAASDFSFDKNGGVILASDYASELTQALIVSGNTFTLTAADSRTLLLADDVSIHPIVLTLDYTGPTTPLTSTCVLTSFVVAQAYQRIGGSSTGFEVVIWTSNIVSYSAPSSIQYLDTAVLQTADIDSSMADHDAVYGTPELKGTPMFVFVETTGTDIDVVRVLFASGMFQAPTDVDHMDLFSAPSCPDTKNLTSTNTTLQFAFDVVGTNADWESTYLGGDAIANGFVRILIGEVGGAASTGDIAISAILDGVVLIKSTGGDFNFAITQGKNYNISVSIVSSVGVSDISSFSKLATNLPDNLNLVATIINDDDTGISNIIQVASTTNSTVLFRY